MFAPPPEIGTRVHARLPEALALPDRPSDWVDVMHAGHRLGSFLEGPSFDRDGNLYLVDIAHGRILRVPAKGGLDVVAEYDGQPNGLKIHRDGRVFVADFKNGIMELDPVSGRIVPFLPRDRFPGFKGFNDLFFAQSGDLYFTDQGLTGLHDPTGRVWRYRVDGRLDCLIDTVPSPNGLVMSPDESLLYIAVTRANAVWRMPFLRDGTPFKVGLFLQLTGSLGGPDGLAVDQAGNLTVAQVGSGSAWQFSALGEPIARIRSCEGLLVTNLAYGGEGNRTLYMTESASGCVLAADMTIPGQPMYSHA